MVQCLGRSGPGLQLGTRRQLARTGRAADSAIGAVRRHEVFLRFPTERNRPTLYRAIPRAVRLNSTFDFSHSSKVRTGQFVILQSISRSWLDTQTISVAPRHRLTRKPLEDARPYFLPCPEASGRHRRRCRRRHWLPSVGRRHHHPGVALGKRRGVRDDCALQQGFRQGSCCTGAKEEG